MCTVIAVSCSLSSLAQTAADQYFDPQEMSAARKALKKGHGNQINSLLIAERLEYLTSNDSDALVWEAQGWVGTDISKFWLKTEGKHIRAEGIEESEIQLLYSRAVSPFWDFQAGIRHDLNPTPNRTHLVLGAQGLAPYWFEVDTAVFISNEGNATVRLETEYEFFLTQRLILQPRVELNLATRADEDLELGRGFFDSVAELRLRYEFRREFAPYLGVSWGGAFGDTADLVKQRGEQPREFSVVAGIRLWF